MRVEIAPATLADVDWIDDLQKRHRDRVGFQFRGAIEQKVGMGQVLVARAVGSRQMAVGRGDDGDAAPSSPPTACCLPPTPLGYCMAADRYMKRDDVGVIYQMNVEPGHQRGLVGAALLKAQFERSAYGVRLYCCWCAQDIAANRFWEAMGFVPLAYRAGSEKRGRVHIFWQKRIRAGDAETPWWFPAQTQGGSMADRLVLPIPPGTHWAGEMPRVILPGAESPVAGCELPGKWGGRRAAKPAEKPAAPAVKVGPLTGGLCFAPPKAAEPAPVLQEERPPEKKPKAKNDPKLVSAARELRDRYLERVNAGARALPAPAGKYDLSRALPDVSPVRPVALLAA